MECRKVCGLKISVIGENRGYGIIGFIGFIGLGYSPKSSNKNKKRSAFTLRTYCG